MICLYCFSSPQQGIFKLSLNSTHQYDGVAKNVYKNTKIFITVNCEEDGDVNIGWMLRETCVSSQPPCNTFEVRYCHTIFSYDILFWFHFFSVGTSLRFSRNSIKFSKTITSVRTIRSQGSRVAVMTAHQQSTRHIFVHLYPTYLTKQAFIVFKMINKLAIVHQ